MKIQSQKQQTGLYDLEKLRRRNEYLEAENALLKKVNVLVVKRETQPDVIGRKPSRN